MSTETKEVKDARIMEKILAVPVEVEIYAVDKPRRLKALDDLKKKANTDKDKKAVAGAIAKIESEEPIKAWMHCLSDLLTIKAINVSAETYRVITADGGDHANAQSGSIYAFNVELLRHSIRVGKEADAAPLFRSGKEVIALPESEYEKLVMKYSQTFSISEDDLGNSLRARTLTSSTN